MNSGDNNTIYSVVRMHLRFMAVLGEDKEKAEGCPIII